MRHTSTRKRKKNTSKIKLLTFSRPARYLYCSATSYKYSYHIINVSFPDRPNSHHHCFNRIVRHTSQFWLEFIIFAFAFFIFFFFFYYAYATLHLLKKCKFYLSHRIPYSSKDILNFFFSRTSATIWFRMSSFISYKSFSFLNFCPIFLTLKRREIFSWASNRQHSRFWFN